MFVKTSAVPVLTLAAYVAKDCVGGLLTFAIQKQVNNAGTTASAVIKRVQITDAAIQDEPFSLHLFDASPAAAARTDADECVQVAADLAKKIVTFTIANADYQTFAGDSIVSYEKDCAIVYDGINIYGVLEATSTPDYVAADDLTVTLWVELR